ncbi:MAG: hypothetical protein LC799_07515, partial [Actinobacteria bacterium]|nr:hypothetical protein [Actinomycetota bacterium]
MSLMSTSRGARDVKLSGQEQWTFEHTNYAAVAEEIPDSVRVAAALGRNEALRINDDVVQTWLLLPVANVPDDEGRISVQTSPNSHRTRCGT